MNISIDSLTPAQLSRLLALDDLPACQPCDASAILQDQLLAPMVPDLVRALPDEHHRQRLVNLLTRQGMPENQSFLAHLTARHPVLEILREIKDFTRVVKDDPASLLQGEPATVLYFATLAAALTARGTRITILRDSELLAGFRWAASRAGAESLFDLFHAAIDHLEPDRDGGVATERPPYSGG